MTNQEGVIEATRTNPFGAVWCDEHDRWECVHQRKKARGGGRCHGRAIVGLDSCRLHVGKRLEQAKAEGAAIHAAWSAWSAERGTADINPADAVLGMLKMTWARVHVYARLLEAQVAQAHDDREAGRDRSPRGAGPIGEGTGLVGHTYAAVKDEGIYASGEAIRSLAQLEAAERDRCVKYAKTAHDMGIADREIRLAEKQGQLIADAVRAILARIGLSAEQQARIPEIVPPILRAIAAGERLTTNP
ncbi:hypothetical protein [Spirillospora sp. CA-294931]|uniref:hypothetical protein n=1 Tax=Spirillospora sp. CA-294931 TaxID=3240042 RepID=UPI003D8B6EAE